jgi:hypothetical protein
MTVAAVGNAICVLHNQDAVCNARESAMAGQVLGARPDGCDGYRVMGGVPDGVKQIAIDSDADGGVDITLPVVSNVYEGHLESLHTVARGIGDAGEVLFTTDIPLDYYADTSGACR